MRRHASGSGVMSWCLHAVPDARPPLRGADAGARPGLHARRRATLALGIGANTAIFSVVNALLLRPLPYPDAHRLVMVWQDLRARGGRAEEWDTPGNVADWKASGLFAEPDRDSGLAGEPHRRRRSGAAPRRAGDLRILRRARRSPGARPRRSRRGDDVPNAPRVVVLSHALWQRRFGGDPGILQQSLTLGGEPHEIIGVMPATFRPGVIDGADVWRPRRLNPTNPCARPGGAHG